MSNHHFFSKVIASILIITPLLLKAQIIDEDLLPHHKFVHQEKDRCSVHEVHQRLINVRPELEEEVTQFIHEDIRALSTFSNTNARSASVLTIPVVFHIIHNGEDVGSGANISDALIYNALNILNADYTQANIDQSNLPAQWQSVSGNPNIEFCLSTRAPDGSLSNGIIRTEFTITGTNADNNNIDNEVKPQVGWDANQYLNIYIVGIPGTTNNSGVIGWAYYPTNSIIGTPIDGVVVDYRWVGGDSDHTMTHEIGHYLGLAHTFNGNSCNGDDTLNDTPNMAASTASVSPSLTCPNNTFPTGPNSCTEEHMYINFMDFVNDQRCYASFSNDQITIMRNVLNGTAGANGLGSRLPMISNNFNVCTLFNLDIAIESIQAPGFQICGTEEINPIVTLKNFGAENLTSCMISYELNNGSPIDFAWVGNLASRESEEITLPSFIPINGNFELTFYTWMPNGTADDNPNNDSTIINPTAIIKQNLPISEDFEDGSFNPTNKGFFVINEDNDALTWDWSPYSAYDEDYYSAAIDNYARDGRGTLDGLATPVFDFTNVTNASLSFEIAYAPFDNSFFDSLAILVSTDCGSVYDELIYLNGNIGMATAPAIPDLFIPTPSQWRNEVIDLSAYDGYSNVSIAFVNIAGYGNVIYLDDIKIEGGNSCQKVVTNNEDNGAGSLRQAIQDVCPGDSIKFNLPQDNLMINLTGDEIVIDKSMVIEGPGMDQLSISGNGNSRIFKINAGAVLKLSELSVENPGTEGSIWNQGTLHVRNVKVE